MFKRFVKWYILWSIPKHAFSLTGDWYVPISQTDHYFQSGVSYYYNYQRIEFSWGRWRKISQFLGSTINLEPLKDSKLENLVDKYLLTYTSKKL